jgi:hypothetical protein
MGKKSMHMIKPKLEASSIMDKTEIDKYIRDVYSGIIYNDKADRKTLKFLPSFILFVCCCVEECYSKKSVHTSKINKRDEVIGHIDSFLQEALTDDDREIIVRIIEDLHSSGRIKRISIVQKFIFHIGNFFFKKNA